MQATIAFVVGIVPVVALQALQRATGRVLKVVIPQAVPEYPLSDLTGLNIWHEARLVEEGIEDMQNLATANLVDVILHTRIPVGRLVDWIDQASLALRLPSRRVESGRDEKKDAPREDLPITRRALEHHGVRTATDLLKAWPATAPEPTAAAALAAPAAPPAGIPGFPDAETAVLVRVLERDTRITAIWNWQARGVARHEAVVAAAVTDADESMAS
jgi:hypothetical protein